MAIKRRVIEGSPSARLSRFVAAAVRVATEYDSDITVGYGGRQADAKRVPESLMVLGKAGRGEWVLVRAEGRDAGEAMEAYAKQDEAPRKQFNEEPLFRLLRFRGYKYPTRYLPSSQ